MKSARGNKKYIINIALMVVLIAVTFAFLFHEFDAKRVFDGIRSSNPFVLVIGIAAVLVYLMCYGLFARTVLKKFGYNVSFIRSLLYAGIDFYYSAITPSASGGQPVVIYNMAKDGIPAARGSFTSLFHTVIYKVVLIALNIVGMLVCYKTVREAGTTFIIFWCVGLVINIALISACVLSMFRRSMTLRLAGFTLRLGAKLHIISNPDERLASFGTALDDYRDSAVTVMKDARLTVKLIAIVLVQRVSFFSIAYIVYRGMGLSGHGYFYLLSIQALVALAVDSLPLPGGIGANEAALVLTLESAFGTPELAAAGMLLIRIINYYFTLVICGAASLAAQFTHKRKSA